MEEEARWDDSSAEASMTVAEPWRCPCGIPPENHHICSAGTCWWCLADRVKAQSDAEPDASVGLIEAAEIAEEWDSGWGEDRNTKVARQTALEIAAAIRARAADRSRK